jgi:hypothetical protein
MPPLSKHTRAQYHNTHPTPTGFALFRTRAHALDAIAMLHGEEFDEGVHLRAEPARKNLFLKVRLWGRLGGKRVRLRACHHGKTTTPSLAGTQHRMYDPPTLSAVALTPPPPQTHTRNTPLPSTPAAH